MGGLSKTGQINALARLYERKKMKFDMAELQTLTAGELRHRIKELRGYKRKGAGRMVDNR